MIIRLISVGHCRPGNVLGKNIYNDEGRVLLGEGVELTDILLKRLLRNGISHLYIQDPRTDDVEIPELLSAETRKQVLRQVRTHFQQSTGRNIRHRVLHSTLGKDFRQVLNLMMDDLSRHGDAMMMLTEMQINDMYLYQHSVNVCTYSILLGFANGYRRDDIMTLGLGGLLHDFGKIEVPIEILRKKDSLTEKEMERVREHPMAGYLLLKDEPNIPLVSAHCALQHHERWDGSGYPRGLKGEEIHEFAQWVGLADSFDALTTHRSYRSAMLPHQAMEVLFSGSGTLYQTEKLQIFRDRMALYPLGVAVSLNTREKGIVVDINASAPHRPVVRILEDADGVGVRQPYEVDLSKQWSVMITEVNSDFN